MGADGRQEKSERSRSPDGSVPSALPDQVDRGPCWPAGLRPGQSSSITGSLGAARGERAPGPGDGVLDAVGVHQHHLDRDRARAAAGDDGAPVLPWVSERAALVAGIAEATMSRDDAWRFLVLGHSLERADMTARFGGHQRDRGSIPACRRCCAPAGRTRATCGPTAGWPATSGPQSSCCWTGSSRDRCAMRYSRQRSAWRSWPRRRSGRG